MPLVRIALRKGHSPGYSKRLGEAVHRAMVETIDVPAKDRFQLITEHDETTLVYDPTYLEIARSDDVIFIQITMSEGRSVERKKALYKAIARNLNAELGVRTEDVFINLVEVKKENWSFGNGIASYAT
jgi:phenylpyruvate tautomerase PptA (4-oxalocrotonate tautomerase family)